MYKDDHCKQKQNDVPGISEALRYTQQNRK